MAHTHTHPAHFPRVRKVAGLRAVLASEQEQRGAVQQRLADLQRAADEARAGRADAVADLARTKRGLDREVELRRGKEGEVEQLLSAFQALQAR